MQKLLSTTALLAVCVGLSAQSPLSTTFANNNAGGVGGGVYFDLDASVDLQITALDLNCNSTGAAPVDISVFWRVGTHAGSETNPAAWNVGSNDTGGVLSSPAGTPTAFTLVTPICIPANVTIGIAIQMNGTGNAYTNGPLGPFSTAELTFTGGTASNAAFVAPLFSPRVANCNIYYTVGACTPYAPPGLVATTEPVPGTTPLVPGDDTFTALDFLTWGYDDPLMASQGLFAVTALNFGDAGGPPVGVTASLPGLQQVWAGSTPVGYAAILPPNVVIANGPTFSMFIPPGIFTSGQTIRIQGIVLDPAHATGPLPVVVTPNTITWTYTDCAAAEFFDSTPTGAGSYPNGWSDGGGTIPWTNFTGSTGSTGTGPTAAQSGSNYMYCETSSPATTGNTYIMNSDVYPSAGLTTLEYWLHRVGATIGTFELRMGDGTGTFPTVLQTYTGAGTSGVWDQELITLPSTLPANVQFQFHYTYGGSFTGDLAVDSFCLR